MVRDISSDLKELLKFAYSHDEHLKKLNGNIARHEEQFKKVYEDFNKLIDSGNVRFVCVEDRVKQTEFQIQKAHGVMIGFGIVTSLLSVASITKSLGLW